MLESEIALERYVKFQTSITNLPLNMISQGYLISTKSNVFTSRKVDIIGIEQSIKSIPNNDRVGFLLRTL